MVLDVQAVLSVDNRLHPAAGPSSSFLRREGLMWLGAGENEDYFAEEILLIAGKEKRAWCDAAAISYDLMIKTAQEVIKDGRWRELGIPHNAVKLIEYSIQHELNNYLVGRFDFAGGFGDFPLKMLEFNADTCSLMPETAKIQRHLWENTRRCPGKGPVDALIPALVQRFKRILNQHPNKERSLLLSTMGYEEDWLNTDVVAEAARAAGFEIIQSVPLEEVIFDPEKGIFTEPQPDQFTQFDFWYKMIPWDFIAYEEQGLMNTLSRLVMDDKVVIFNPAWTMVLQSKGLCPFLAQKFSGEPTQLKAHFSSTSFPQGKYARKPIFGRTGENVALFDGNARPLAENKGDYGHVPMIYQELAGFYTDTEGYRYQGSVFFTDQPVSLAFRRQDDPIIDDDAEYIAHSVV